MLCVLDATTLLCGVASFLVFCTAGGMRWWIQRQTKNSPERWFDSPKTLRKHPGLASTALPTESTDRAALARGYYRFPIKLAFLSAFLIAYAYSALVAKLILESVGPHFLEALDDEVNAGTIPATMLALLCPASSVLAALIIPLIPTASLYVTLEWVIFKIEPRVRGFKMAMQLMGNARTFLSRHDSLAHRQLVLSGLNFLTIVGKLGVPGDDHRVVAIHETLKDSGRNRRNVSLLPEYVQEILSEISSGRFEFSRERLRLSEKITMPSTITTAILTILLPLAKGAMSIFGSLPL